MQDNNYLRYVAFTAGVLVSIANVLQFIGGQVNVLLEPDVPVWSIEHALHMLSLPLGRPCMMVVYALILASAFRPLQLAL